MHSIQILFHAWGDNTADRVPALLVDDVGET